MSDSGEPTEWREIDRHDSGVGWIAYPDESMQRASHAVAVDGAVWLIDPVDVPDLDDLLSPFGEVAGVVILLDRHKRDCAAIANRYDVSVWVPTFMDGVADEIDAPVERFSHGLADSGFVLYELYDKRFWQEGLLFDEERGVLVVPEAVGTAGHFVTHSERLGVHPMLRLTPPSALERFDPERILVGHGEGIHEDATEAIADALSSSRAHAPGLFVKNVTNLLPGFR